VLGPVKHKPLSRGLLWCTEAEEYGFLPWFVDLQAARTESGRPRSSIRLRTVTAIRVSTSWAGRVCERKVCNHPLSTAGGAIEERVGRVA
jgi:hypothetical protein